MISIIIIIIIDMRSIGFLLVRRPIGHDDDDVPRTSFSNNDNSYIPDIYISILDGEVMACLEYDTLPRDTYEGTVIVTHVL